MADAHHAVKETIFEADEVHVVTSTAGTLTTFAVLAVLAAVQIAVGFSDLGSSKVVANLAIAAVQTGVMGVFFMDLRQADKLTWLCVGAAIFWTGLQFLFTLTDYLTRGIVVTPGGG